MFKVNRKHLYDLAKNECDYFNKVTSDILLDYCKMYNPKIQYDIFLSHSYRDAELILGVKIFFEQEMFCLNRHPKVYIDWIDDKDLNRNKVNIDTAKRLKLRMNNSKSLFFIETEHAIDSKWMPWEIGYFDGYKNKIAVLQITDNNIEESDDFSFREYLNLYPTAGRICSELYIKENGEKINFINWINL